MLRPMLLQELEQPFQDQDYLYEIKFDGIRAFIYASKKEFKILSRNGINITNQYPELKNIQKLAHNHKLIFDGEIIATSNGLPSFQLVQKRSKQKKVSLEDIKNTPVTFIAFDLLYDQYDLTKFPLIKRKKLLAKYKDTDYFVKSKCYENGVSLFKMIKKIGLEGVVAKKKSSKYFFGKRTNEWIKIKNIKVDFFWVHGYQEKTNTYSLLLGEYNKNKFIFVGKVSIAKNHFLIKEIKKLKGCQNNFSCFNEKACFIVPKIKVRVRFLEKNKTGILRHAVIDE